MIDSGEDLVVLDARPFHEYATMAIPGGINVPGAELILRARSLAPNPSTRIVVNCAGRTRSLIGAQSLINGGIPNRVDALRNGTIGWTLAGQELAYGLSSRFGDVSPEILAIARTASYEVAYRAGVRRLDTQMIDDLTCDTQRTLYRFDVRTPEEYARGHRPDFHSAPGGQLVQEIDVFAPVRGARIVLADDLGPRANMTASWLAQMGWDVYVLDGGFEEGLETGSPPSPPPRSDKGRYKRPYEGTDNPSKAMHAYLDWEFGLVAQLERDGSHGFSVI
jgi:rhodanese-related sulfurtransferase